MYGSTGRGVPHDGRPVGAGGGAPLAGWAVGDCCDWVLMGIEGENHLPGSRVADPGDAIREDRERGDHPAAVRAEGYAVSRQAKVVTLKGGGGRVLPGGD